MKKLALSASMLGAIALAACGGDDGGIIVPDGGGSDGGNVGICNPSTQMGCNPDEKCTALFPTTPGQPIVTGCVPDGTGADGDTCVAPMGDGNGGFTGGVDAGNGTLTDDCSAGFFCDNQGGASVCTPICSLAGFTNTCGDGVAGEPRACVGINGIFDDLPMGSEAGFCTPQCNPTVDQATCPGGEGCCAAAEGCYSLLISGTFVCASPAAGAEELGTGAACAPTTPDGNCFINSAPIGSTMFFPETWPNGSGVITPYCLPVETHDAAPASDPDGAAPQDCTTGGVENVGFANQHNLLYDQCRFVNAIYSGFQTIGEAGLPDIPDTAGVCVNGDPATQGFVLNPPAGWNIEPEAWDLQASVEDEGDGSGGFTVPFCPGCAPRLLTFPPAAAPTNRTDLAPLPNVVPKLHKSWVTPR